MRHASRLVVRASALAIAIVASSAACTLLTSFDGLSDEAAARAGDGSSPESAMNDGADPDVVRPPGDGEGGADAGSDASWCEKNAPGATFCEDFDRFGLARFTGVEQTNATAQVVAGDARSSPSALLVSGSGPAEIHGRAAFQWPATSTDVTLAADVRVDKANAAGSQPAQFLVLFFGAAPGYQIGVGATGTAHERYVFFYEPTTSNYGVLARSGTWVLGQWVRVTLHVHLAGVGSGTVDVDFDGLPLAKDLPIAPPLASSAVELSVGIPFANAGHDGWAVRTDDVAFVAK
jgi:hypothetical protein